MIGMEVELRLLFPKKEPHGLLGEGACLALAQAPQTQLDVEEDGSGGVMLQDERGRIKGWGKHGLFVSFSLLS